jgi:hypothetical protein
MASTTASTSPLFTSTTSSNPPSPTSSATDPVPAHNASPIVAFIIGLAIILLASILNAAGLNLTKLDHVWSLLIVQASSNLCAQVRTKAIPKNQRRRDWLRPLWLLGMVLYMCVPNPFCIRCHSKPRLPRLSQLIGSTLALEYLRAGLLRPELPISFAALSWMAQNTLRHWGLVRSYSIFCSPDFW